MPRCAAWAAVLAAAAAPVSAWTVALMCNTGGCADSPPDRRRIGEYMWSVRSVVDEFRGKVVSGHQVVVRHIYISPLGSADLGDQLAALIALSPNHVVATSAGVDTWVAASGVAWQLPGTYFSLIDAFSLFECETSDGPTEANFQGKGCHNVQVVAFREDQAAFLVGVLAGKVTDTGRVSMLAGLPIPAIHRFRNGFANGVRKVCPHCVVDALYANDFADPEMGTALCADLVSRRQGRADVLFAAAGGTGSACILEGARRGVQVIGVDTDEYHTTFRAGNKSVPEGRLAEFLLSSALKRVDVAVSTSVVDAIEAAAGQEMWSTGWRILDITIDAIGAAQCHETCAVWEAHDVSVAIETTYAQLQAGSILTGADPVDARNHATPWVQEETAYAGRLYSLAGHFGDEWSAPVAPILVHHPSPTTDAILVLGDFAEVWTYHHAQHALDRQGAPGSPGSLEHFAAASAFSSVLVHGGRLGNLSGALYQVGHCIPCGANPTWARIEPAPGAQPEPRQRHSMLSDSAAGVAYIIFGTGERGLLGDMWWANLSTGAWREVSVRGPEARTDAAAASAPLLLTLGNATDDYWLLVFGGLVRGGTHLADLWALPAGSAGRAVVLGGTADWIRVEVDSSVAGRARSCLSVTSVHIVVAGGVTAGGPATDLWVRHHDAQQWAQLHPSESWPPREPALEDICGTHERVLGSGAARFHGGVTSCAMIEGMQVPSLVTRPWELPPKVRRAQLYMATLGGSRSGAWVLRTLPLINCSAEHGLVADPGGAGCRTCQQGEQVSCTLGADDRQRCACVVVPDSAGDGFPLWALAVIAGGLAVLAVPIVWKLVANRIHIMRLYNNNRIAEECAVAIAAMQFEEQEELLVSIPEPNAIQTAFLQIISILKLYREYLPQSVLQDVAATEPNDPDGPLLHVMSLNSKSNSLFWADRRQLSQVSMESSTGSRQSAGWGGTMPAARLGGARGRLSRSAFQRTRSATGDDIRDVRARLAVGLTQKRATVVTINLRGFLSSPIGPGELADQHSAFLSTVMQRCRECSGTPDPFSGDHLTIHFNTTVPSCTHCTSACSVAHELSTIASSTASPSRSPRARGSEGVTSPDASMDVELGEQQPDDRLKVEPVGSRLTTPSPRHSTVCPGRLGDVTIGIATGSARCGNMGPCGAKAYCVLGACFPHAVLLNLLAKHNALCCLVDDRVRAEARTKFRFAAGGRYLCHKAGHTAPATLYELSGPADSGEAGEWMYQLGHLEATDPFAPLDGAVDAYVRGDPDTAVARLEGAPQEAQEKARWLHALLGCEHTRDAGCTWRGHVRASFELDGAHCVPDICSAI